MRLLHSIAIKFSIKKYFLKTDCKLQLKIRVFFKQNQKFNIEWNMYCNMHAYYVYYRFHLQLILYLYERHRGVKLVNTRAADTQ